MENLTKKQKVSTKPDTYALKEWLKTIAKGDYTSTVKEITERCKFNDFRLRNIMAGLSSFKPLERDQINIIAGYDIFERFNLLKDSSN